MNHKKTNPPVGLGLSRDYFSQNLIPSPPAVNEIRYYSPSALMHYDGIEILYVLEGEGIFCTNAINYDCKKGSLIMLFFYHLTRVIPKEGQALRVYRCKFTTNTLLYFLANPCSAQASLGLEEEPVFVEFEGDEKNHIDTLFMELKKELSENSPFHENMSILILMEIIARIDRELG